MTLRLRLILLITGLVALTAIVLSTIHINSLVTTELSTVADRSLTTAQFIKEIVLRRSNAAPPPPGLNVRDFWQSQIATDPELPEILARTLAQTRYTVEVNVAGERGAVLVSSNPSQKGALITPRLGFRRLMELTPVDRLLAILGGSVDYETRVSLGIPGESAPIFTIQVLTSSVLLREAMVPAIARMALVSLFSMVLAVLLSWLAARIALRPLTRISQSLDRIAKGEPVESEPRAAREYAVVEEKLRLLGEQYLEAKQDATQSRENTERRLVAIGKLTTGVAHEIKNPLNSIALHLEVLRSKVLEEVPESEPEFNVLTHEVSRLDRVVRTFLDFTKPVELQSKELDLTRITTELVDLIQPEADRQGVALKLEHPGVPQKIRGDADLIRQGILNVLRNALEALPAGGNVQVAVGSEGKQRVVSVTDSGPGIGPESKEKIFNLYYTTKKAGSGIGLALTYRAMQLHNGSVEVASEPGKGATFLMRFPAAVLTLAFALSIAACRKQPPPAPPAPPAPPPKILVDAPKPPGTADIEVPKVPSTSVPIPEQETPEVAQPRTIPAPPAKPRKRPAPARPRPAAEEQKPAPVEEPAPAQPTPQLGEVVSPEARAAHERTYANALSRANAGISRLAKRKLTAEQREEVMRAQGLLQQAEQIRIGDPKSAATLAVRASLLVENLLK
jgi:signal transduction histidine kinase